MASPQCSAPASSPALARPAALRLVPTRAGLSAGRAAQSVAPATARRDPVGPGGRLPRMDGAAGARPVRGGCSPAVAPGLMAAARPAARAGDVPPLRLTRRGRRVIAGLSIAIGLTIAAVTAAVELGGNGGALQLAGSSTVVVQSGDTLWSLAEQLAPEEDPRAVVDAIVDLNGLDSVALVPGQVLELP